MTGREPPAQTIRRAALPITAIALAFLFANAIALTRYPIVSGDEVALNAPARVLASNGRLGSDVLSEDPRRPVPDMIQPPGQALLGAAIDRIFGFGILQARLASIGAGAVAIGLIGFAAAGAFESAAAGAFASAFFAVLPQFSLTAGMGRMDTYCLACLAAGLLLFFAAIRPQRSRWLWLASGLSVGAAMLFHLIAVEYVGGLLAAGALADRDCRRRSLWSFALGAAILPAAWIATSLVFDPRALTSVVGHGATRMGQGNPVVRIVAEAHRWAVDFHRIPVVVALVAATAIWLLRSPHGVRRALVVVAAVALGFNTLFMSKASGSYPIYPLLALAIAAAGMSAEALTGAHGSRWRRITVAAWALLLANGATLVVGPRLIAATIQRDARDYDRVSAAVAAVVPAGATVWGDPRAWYAVVAAGAAMRTPTLWYNPQPDRERDRFVIQRFDAPPPEGYHAVAEIGSPLPIVWGTQVSDTDYRLRIYESRTAGDSPR